MPAEYKSWEELFGEALLETDSQKMPERMAATRQAIAGRHQIEDALRALSFLEQVGPGTGAPSI
jgi:hypothetical protein